MTNEEKIFNLEDDAKIKFEKLLEVAKDIETHGQCGGDQFLRQTVLSVVAKSDNELLFQKLEQALFDNDNSEMLKTIIAGLFLQKENGKVLAKYTDNLLNSKLILDESFEKTESLLLVADGMVNSIKANEEVVDEYVLNILFNLYTASCKADSTAYIADMLLQRFINLLPNKSKFIDQRLDELIHDKNYDFNTRLISVDVLGRSKTFEFYLKLENIVINLADYTNTNTEQLYFLDVATKILNTIIKNNLELDCNKFVNWLDIKDIEEIANRAAVEMILNEIEDTSHVDVISKRIKNRITEISSIHNSNN
jgi:hypothetical protein